MGAEQRANAIEKCVKGGDSVQDSKKSDSSKSPIKEKAVGFIEADDK